MMFSMSHPLRAVFMFFPLIPGRCPGLGMSCPFRAPLPFLHPCPSGAPWFFSSVSPRETSVVHRSSSSPSIPLLICANLRNLRFLSSSVSFLASSSASWRFASISVHPCSSVVLWASTLYLASEFQMPLRFNKHRISPFKSILPSMG